MPLDSEDETIAASEAETIALTIRMPRNERKRLAEVAQREQRTLSMVARRSIKAYCEQSDRTEPRRRRVQVEDAAA